MAKFRAQRTKERRQASHPVLSRNYQELSSACMLVTWLLQGGKTYQQNQAQSFFFLQKTSGVAITVAMFPELQLDCLEPSKPCPQPIACGAGRDLKGGGICCLGVCSVCVHTSLSVHIFLCCLFEDDIRTLSLFGFLVTKFNS